MRTLDFLPKFIVIVIISQRLLGWPSGKMPGGCQTDICGELFHKVRPPQMNPVAKPTFFLLHI